MAIAKTTLGALRLAGWTAKDEIPANAMEKLEKESSSAIPLFQAVNEIYEIFHHEGSNRWMLITDGGGSFTVNAPGILIASANPNRKDTNSDDTKQRTIVFTIGLDDGTVSNWLRWVGYDDHLPEKRPDCGFHYVS
jgi:hypothetical protein